MKIVPKRWEDLSAEEKKQLLGRSEQDIQKAAETVQPIVESVRNEGDAAVFRYTEQFDHADISGMSMAATEEEFEAAEKILSDGVKDALIFAVENVRTFHEEQKPGSGTFREIRRGIFAGEKAVPVESAGLYVPRGRGSFPSMLYMLAVPAAAAGVPAISVVTPPNPDGSIDPGCLFAARLCGVNTVYRIGGAQAIAALAYGTESVSPVVKLTGPGSMYVAAAKRLVSHILDTGLPAGPSESIILADRSANPEKASLDLLIEAEHGSDSSALLITDSEELGNAVARTLGPMIDTLPEPRKTFVRDVFNGYGGILLVGSIEEGAELINRFAPEHLQLQTEEPFTTLSSIRNAGEILLGEHTPFSAANYVTGANAVLPTGGAARTYSAVSVRDFMKYSSVVYVTKEGYERCKPHVLNLADYEGFITHGNAFRNRPE